MEVKVYDNFLPHDQFLRIQELLLSPSFVWFFADNIDYHDEPLQGKFQFVHPFYGYKGVESHNFVDMTPLIDKLDCRYLLKGKANLNVKGDGNAIGQFHTDVNLDAVTKTAVFYINTNNGGTEFENGDIVRSIENRVVIFDSKIKHRGISCTNEKRRVLLNWNWIPATKTNY